MKKTMEDITVEVDGEIISLSQYSTDNSVITLHPDQVGIVVRWLQEARKIARQNAKEQK